VDSRGLCQDQDDCQDTRFRDAEYCDVTPKKNDLEPMTAVT